MQPLWSATSKQEGGHEGDQRVFASASDMVSRALPAVRRMTPGHPCQGCTTGVPEGVNGRTRIPFSLPYRRRKGRCIHGLSAPPFRAAGASRAGGDGTGRQASSAPFPGRRNLFQRSNLETLSGFSDAGLALPRQVSGNRPPPPWGPRLKAFWTFRRPLAA
jgi:hypothetical protein